MHLMLLETSGNQRYIFATNKLRENVGASELTYRVGTKTVLQAVKEVVGIDLLPENDLDGSKLRATLLDPKKNRPIGQGNKVEVIVATSGKAILLVDDDVNKTISKQIIREVTQTALRKMPGLTIHGALSEPFGNLANNDFSLVHEAIVEVHHRLEGTRYQMPSNEQRFLRLPFFAQCKTSGLPAQTKTKEGTEEILISNLSAKKRDAYGDSQKRLQAVVDWYSKEKKQAAIHLISDVNRLEQRFKDLNWLAVIHADGNGLGEVFLNFNKYAGFDNNGNQTGRQYLDDYRKFSIELDICTINATGFALRNLQETYQTDHPQVQSIEVPSIPIVLGGDDLTVLCDGKYALKFAHDFLKQFEEETSQNEVVWRIANNAFGNKDETNPSVKRLSICAGVAIVKPHFPFHQAYELAEQLLKSAKQVKEKMKHLRKDEDGKDEEVQLPASAMDFHILYDSTYSELELIREKLRVDNENTHLYAKPYIVSVIDGNEIKFKDDAGEKKAKASEAWLKNHKFSEIENRVKAMNERDDDDKRKLPNSQLHGLREALYLGKDETTARVNLIAHRYESESQEKEKSFSRLLVEDTKTLFFDETRKIDENEIIGHATHFLDALDVIEFWRGFPAPNDEKGAGGK